MVENTKKNEKEMTREEFVAELKRLKDENEEKLAKALDVMSDIEDAEPCCEGVKYERWLDKYEDQQAIIDSYEDVLERIDEYLVTYDTAEGGV